LVSCLSSSFHFVIKPFEETSVHDVQSANPFRLGCRSVCFMVTTIYIFIIRHVFCVCSSSVLR